MGAAMGAVTRAISKIRLLAVGVPKERLLLIVYGQPLRPPVSFREWTFESK
jgi:hypothetical protein